MLILYTIAYSFLFLLFEVEKISGKLCEIHCMLKTASLTAKIMLYGYVYVWIYFYISAINMIRIFQLIKLLWLVLPYRIASVTSVNILLSMCVLWRKYLELTDHVVIHTYQCLQIILGGYLYNAAPLFSLYLYLYVFQEFYFLVLFTRL